MLKVPHKRFVAVLLLFLFFFFLGSHWRHMDVPRLGLNQSYSCWLTLQPQQRWILDTLSEARDQTCILTDTNRISFPLCHKETPQLAVILTILALHTEFSFTCTSERKGTRDCSCKSLDSLCLTGLLIIGNFPNPYYKRCCPKKEFPSWPSG